jgi:excisionase family DNA binding protein
MAVDEMLLVEEVARATRTSEATVRWWIRTGKLPASKPGKRLLIRRSELEALLSRKAVSAPRTLQVPQLRIVPNDLDRKRAEDALRRLGL